MTTFKPGDMFQRGGVRLVLWETTNQPRWKALYYRRNPLTRSFPPSAPHYDIVYPHILISDGWTYTPVVNEETKP